MSQNDIELLWFERILQRIGVLSILMLPKYLHYNGQIFAAALILINIRFAAARFYEMWDWAVVSHPKENDNFSTQD